MIFQDDPNAIFWRIHLKSPIAKVFQALSTDTGRASFWAESAVERNGVIHFVFPNQLTWEARILESSPPHKFVLQYYNNSITTFRLDENGEGSTELILRDEGVPFQDRTEVIAGWVSVLLNLKGAMDFGVDLRNHSTNRHWESGYADN